LNFKWVQKLLRWRKLIDLFQVWGNFIIKKGKNSIRLQPKRQFQRFLQCVTMTFIDINQLWEATCKRMKLSLHFLPLTRQTPFMSLPTTKSKDRFIQESTYAITMKKHLSSKLIFEFHNHINILFFVGILLIININILYSLLLEHKKHITFTIIYCLCKGKNVTPY
jgi:hypothetical protein